MNDYPIRAIEQDWPQVIALGKLLGELTEHEGKVSGNGWDFIGPIPKPTGETVIVDGLPVALTEPVRDENGNVYLHANLRTEQDLAEVARGMLAKADAEVVEWTELAARPDHLDEDTGEMSGYPEYAAGILARKTSERDALYAQLGPALSQLRRFFVTDADGKVAAPKNPHRVFF